MITTTPQWKVDISFTEGDNVVMTINDQYLWGVLNTVGKISFGARVMSGMIVKRVTNFDP